MNQATPLIPQHVTHLQSPATSREEYLSRSPRRFRFVKHFAYFAVLWLGYIFLSDYAHYKLERAYDSLNKFTTPDPEFPIPFPPDVTIKHCADWDEDTLFPADISRRYSFPLVFELPVSSDTLFLISRGTARGSVNIIQSSHIIGDVALIEVVAKYQGHTNRVKVCSMSRGDNDSGIGFLGPMSSHDYLEVTVHLPTPTGKSPLHINNFETDLPLFSHDIGDIETTAAFDTISLRGALMPITVKSLYATKMKLETSNGAIEGSLNTSSSIEISTTKAPINVNVKLFNGKDSEATKLTMNTNYSPINADINLASSSNKGGEFEVTSTTIMSPLRMVFPTAPIGSTLRLDARTSFSPASVQLHETFEGAFNLLSTTRPAVFYNEDAEDPAGKGRKRKVGLDSIWLTRVTGSAKWSDEGASGAVNIEAQLSSATLEL